MVLTIVCGILDLSGYLWFILKDSNLIVLCLFACWQNSKLKALISTSMFVFFVVFLKIIFLIIIIANFFFKLFL